MRHSEHEKIYAIRRVKAGESVENVCRTHEISTSTFDKWWDKYGEIISLMKPDKKYPDTNSKHIFCNGPCILAIMGHKIIGVINHDNVLKDWISQVCDKEGISPYVFDTWLLLRGIIIGRGQKIFPRPVDKNSLCELVVIHDLPSETHEDNNMICHRKSDSANARNRFCHSSSILVILEHAIIGIINQNYTWDKWVENMCNKEEIDIHTFYRWLCDGGIIIGKMGEIFPRPIDMNSLCELIVIPDLPLETKLDVISANDMIKYLEKSADVPIWKKYK